MTGDVFTASADHTAFAGERILTGTETVFDDTLTYERGEDYELAYSEGTIRALPEGDLVVGSNYRIDYREVTV